MQLKIGIDFDNTIVCYNSIFQAIALEKGIRIPDPENAKMALRDHLRQQPLGELEWTKIQGEVYGPRILQAQPFEGVIDFFRYLRSEKIPFCIISHKTKYPVIGAVHDLHEWAVRWLESQGFFKEIALEKNEYFLELKKESKLERIATESCTHFIDDLPEFLSEAGFPNQTTKILFSPALAPGIAKCFGETSDLLKERNGFVRLKSWKAILHFIEEESKKPLQIRTLSSSNGDQKISSSEPQGPLQQGKEFQAFSDLLRLHGSEQISALEPLKGGANNRAFRILTTVGKKYFGKVYFRSPQDPRNRLGNEFAFLSFVAPFGLKCPKPIGMNAALGIAIYEYIDGKPLENVSPVYWTQCLEFLIRLQTKRALPNAKELPYASEAAFSLDEHLAHVRTRRDHWLSLAKSSDIHPELKELVINDLENAYQRLAHRIFSVSNFRKEIDFEARILSPSDFGLHNAILGLDERLTFIDFEYAGWDDPAKTVVDFFCQPKFPAPQEFSAQFIRALSETLPQQHQKAFLNRLELVKPCISLKWCYILLNDFHPEASKRRQFSLDSKPNPKLLAERIFEIRQRLQKYSSAPIS